VSSLFLHHSELNVRVYDVKVAEKVVELLWTMWPDDKCIVHISEPTARF
jgi:hypothetical protein